MLTFEEICEELKKLDEVTLIETLELNSTDIVEAFDGLIQEKLEDIYRQITGEEIDDPVSE